jgi:hypothetical protein
MTRTRLVWIAVFTGITLVLLPNFYRNRWTAVEPGYYSEWQTRYDRFVLARLVKTRQEGFFSAGGLMGLGDTDRWNLDTQVNRDQYESYLKNRSFTSYLVYRSNPGLQGIVYGTLDKTLPITGAQKLKAFRGLTAFLTAMVFGLILTTIAMEFGILPGLLALLFTIFSMWIVLPAGSIFWDYWGFYLPFLASAYLLAEAAAKNRYHARRIHIWLALAALAKAIVSGFDLTTTVLVMATVPFVYHAIYQEWDLKTFLLRFFKASFALLAGTVAALLILALQLIANQGTPGSAYSYILNRFTSHLEGNYSYFSGQDVVARRIGIMEVVPKYLAMPAIRLQIQSTTIQFLYWHVLVLFAIFTAVFLLIHRDRGGRLGIPRKSLALLVATWYSMLAPLSWYVIFRPHSYIHTHVNTMGWQMPFTILGFAFCGLVISDLLLRIRARSTASASDTA